MPRLALFFVMILQYVYTVYVDSSVETPLARATHSEHIAVVWAYTYGLYVSTFLKRHRQPRDSESDDDHDNASYLHKK